VSARYSIGIDLGTTHCVLSYVDLTQSEREKVLQKVFPIPQLTAPGTLDDVTVLGSFLYLPHDSEFAANDLTLPWNEKNQRVTGEFARSRGIQTPIRLVSSAKSWLCHSGVDCRQAFLPLDAPSEVSPVSPLEATTAYLSYLREAWNHKNPDNPIEKQEVIITIPASFDPAARDLTVVAAKDAGLSQAILLEEPQAALYSWIQASEGQWRKQVRVGEVILVVDMGGGTTDLSLIAVTEQDGDLVLNRVAVGDHILLGGDNMDLALAYVLKAKLAAEGKSLENWQIQGLTHACRVAKEQLLSDAELNTIPIVVPSRTSKLIGGSLRTELTREEVINVLVNGFFPQVEITDKPQQRPRAALTKISLPYAQDPAVTRHLAAFLTRQIQATAELSGFSLPEGARFLHPTAVLFNGGVFQSELLAQRVETVINQWLASDNAPPVRILQGIDLELAVGRGAAYYGYVRQGHGVRIRGGLASAYYVGIEGAMPAVPGMEPPLEALCVAPFGMEEGTEARLPDQEFGLVVGESVRFRFFGSSVRREDQVGTLLETWADSELIELEAIEATLPADEYQPGDIVPVRLHAAVTEVGTLRLEAVPRQGQSRWQVELNVREREK
jgi:molecular chaperone DnaK (HSP70)